MNPPLETSKKPRRTRLKPRMATSPTCLICKISFPDLSDVRNHFANFHLITSQYAMDKLLGGAGKQFL
jgi:hypothetical protein